MGRNNEREGRDAEVAEEEVAPEALEGEAAAPVDPLTLDGFHVTSGGEYVGTYESKADAQAFIDAHLVPQEKAGEIVCVPPEAPEPEVEAEARR